MAAETSLEGWAGTGMRMAGTDGARNSVTVVGAVSVPCVVSLMLPRVAVDWVAVHTSRTAGTYSRARTSWWPVMSAALTGASRATVPLAGASSRVLPSILTRMAPVAGWPATVMLPVTRVGCRPGATGTASCCPDWPGMADTEPMPAGAAPGPVVAAAALPVCAVVAAAALAAGWTWTAASKAQVRTTLPARRRWSMLPPWRGRLKLPAVYGQVWLKNRCLRRSLGSYMSCVPVVPTAAPP